MDTSTTTTATSHRRLVLLPLPFQGHLNPMLQLANILHSKGFSIIILHTLCNSPNPTNYPHFNFVPIPGTGDDILNFSDMDKIIRVLLSINTKFMNPIKECLELLMSEDDGVACLITDAQWFGTQDVADILKLPRIVHRTSNISSFVCFAASLPLYVNGLFQRYSDEGLLSTTSLIIEFSITVIVG